MISNNWVSRLVARAVTAMLYVPKAYTQSHRYPQEASTPAGQNATSTCCIRMSPDPVFLFFTNWVLVNRPDEVISYCCGFGFFWGGGGGWGVLLTEEMK